jgi:hypothetical protein
MYRTKADSPRNEHRAKQALRVEESPTLAEKFPKLKTLSAEFTFTDSNRPNASSSIKYFLELDSKSVFRLGCRNNECVGGDFDLSAVLVAAIAQKHTIADGELRCQGWRDKNSIHKHHCTSVLNYRLSFGY